mmetsp:Transcript_7586/g.21562  ORF Transcript_7586/g.21562 Transcript_7586/m.21562 type:complete len:230 (-) Transcript_7586:1425-2114(-)
MKLSPLAVGNDVVVDHSCHRLVGAEFREGEFCQGALRAGPTQKNFLVRYNDGHQESLETVPMDEGLSHPLALNEDILDLLRGNVLALGKLKDVLLPIDDLETAVRQDSADITRVEPSVLIDGILGLLLLLVVANKACRGAHTQFPPRVGLVATEVVHLRNIYELQLGARGGGTNVAARIIARNGRGCHGSAFGLAVALHNLAAKAEAQEVQHVTRDGSRSRHHDLHTAA